MSVPNWLPEPTESWKPDQKICLLDSFSIANDFLDKEEARVKDPFFLYVKTSPGGKWKREEYKVVLFRDHHPALGRWYMTKKDDPNIHRRYKLWIGFDMDRFGAITSEELFLRRLEADVLAENIFAQDTVPMVNGPKQAFWMEMYGYFGNLYEAEGRKGLVTAAKKHIQLLRQLCDRGEVKFKMESHGIRDLDLAKDMRRGRGDTDYKRFVLSEPMTLIFPEFAKKEIQNGDGTKRFSDCKLA